MPEKKTKEQVVEEFRIQTIHEAAMRVIARKGIAQATMQEIADEAGIAKGTIYLYFQDRTRLFESVADTTVERLLSELEPIWEENVSVGERLAKIVRSQFLFFEENGELFRAFQSLHENDPDARCRREQHPLWERYLDRLESLLVEGMKRRELRRRDPRRLAMFLADSSRSLLFRRVVDRENPAVEDDVELVVSTILHGITNERKSK